MQQKTIIHKYTKQANKKERREHKEESKINKTNRAIKIHDLLMQHYPNLSTFLTHKNPFELLIAVILSQITPSLKT